MKMVKIIKVKVVIVKVKKAFKKAFKENVTKKVPQEKKIEL